MKTIRFFAVNLLFVMLATIFVSCEGSESTRIIGEWKLVKETYTYNGETETYHGTAPYSIWQFNEDCTFCSYSEDEEGEEHIYMPYLLEGEQITIDGETLLKIQKLSKSQLILDMFIEEGTTYLLYFEHYDTDEPTNKKDNRIGKFSVSESKQVTFSPGNLQYHPANNEWRFAKSQLDYIGEENWNISSTYYGWIDLFGWSGDTCVVKFGVSASTKHKDYEGSFVDWGTNQIGDDAPNTWRTLTRDEWYYLRSTRANADNLIGVAQVNGVNGLILLPDKWKCPAGVSFKSGFCSKSADDGDYAIHQTFSSEQWSILELSGAIFLPAAGKRGYAKEYSLHRWGAYWSSSHDFTELAQAFSFYNDGTSIGYDGDTTTGRSVRLVKDL